MYDNKIFDIRGIRTNYNQGDEFKAVLPFDAHREVIWLRAKKGF